MGDAPLSEVCFFFFAHMYYIYVYNKIISYINVYHIGLPETSDGTPIMRFIPEFKKRMENYFLRKKK